MMKYNFITEPSGPKSVTVITPTIGQKHLIKAIESVHNQTYMNVKHLVVVDGLEYFDNVNDYDLSKYQNLQVTVSPENTGKTGGNWYGHRIYSAYPFLINSDYVAFLDEDNWYDPNHIESLVNTLESNPVNDWVYSLRKICQPNGEYLIDDSCESLGKWPVYWSILKEENNREHLVDTSTYLFKRSFLIQVCHHWYHGWGGDRRFYHILSKVLMFNNYETTGSHTLNYRLDDNMEKKYGNKDFFVIGNAVVLNYYGDYPWRLKI
jgi:glycosyltransferase involved in cell wall biosynthesis